MIGQVKISKDVIATVVAVAVREVPGISGISNTVPDEIKKLIKNKNFSKGIDIELNEETKEISITVYISIKYGYEIQKVSYDVQSKIKHAVETMLNLIPVSINVNIAGVSQELGKENE